MATTVTVLLPYTAHQDYEFVHNHDNALLSAPEEWRARHHCLTKKVPLTYSITNSKGVSLGGRGVHKYPKLTNATRLDFRSSTQN